MPKKGEEVFLHYKGPVQYDTIGGLISELKERMFESQIKQAVYKKVLMVMIESLENIFKYHEHFDHDKVILKNFPPTIEIARSRRYFKVTCSNPVRRKDVEHFRKRLESIVKLDKNGIKEIYKQTITNGQFSEKGGAGLGIIEIAKISDEKLDFSFRPINDDFELYTLELIIYCS